MKKIVSLLVATLLLTHMTFLAPVAEVVAKISSDNVNVDISGKYSVKEIHNSLKDLKNGEISLDEINTKYEKQLIPVNLYCSGVDNINKIYGLQFTVTSDNSDVMFAYITTNIQNGSKIGSSRWNAYMNALDASFCKARALLYGTKPLNNNINKAVNMIETDKYSISTLYLIADKGFNDEANITISVEDIASKDSNGTVNSAVDKFEMFTSFTIKDGKQKNIKLQMLGAQVRTKLPQGIRFGTKVDFGTLKNKIEDVSYGTLIAVTNQLESNELTLETEQVYQNSVGSVYSEQGGTVVFTGEITNFPKDGRFDTVNFTARGYIRYKKKGSNKYTVVYSEPIIRNVDNIKSQLSME